MITKMEGADLFKNLHLKGLREALVQNVPIPKLWT